MELCRGKAPCVEGVYERFLLFFPRRSAKMVRKWLFVGLLCFSKMGGAVSEALCQTVDSPKAAIGNQNVVVDPIAVAKIRFGLKQPNLPNGEIELRTLSLQRGPEGSGIYFIDPILAPCVMPEPIDGYPEYVMDVDRDSVPGQIFVTIMVQTFSDEVKNFARNALLEVGTGDREAALKSRTEDEIDVRLLPLLHMISMVRNAKSGEVLAVAQSGSLVNVEGGIKLVYKFTPEKFKAFLNYAEKGRVEYVYYYTYQSTHVKKGEMSSTVRVNSQLVLNSMLSSAQLEGKTPVFQGQESNVYRMLSVNQVRNLRGPREILELMIPLENSYVGALLFEPQTFISVNDLQNDKELTVQLAKYLRPHLEALRDELTKQDIKMMIHEAGSSESELDQAGFSLFGLGGETANETQEHVLDQIRQRTGVQMTQVKNSERFVPHSVSVKYLKKGGDNRNFESVDNLVLEISAANRYVEDSPVSGQFTTDVVNKEARLNYERQVAGMPIGAIIDCVANKIPWGWEIIKEGNYFPNSIHFAEQLRGKEMFDLSNTILLAASEISQNGQSAMTGLFSTESGGLIVTQTDVQRTATPPDLYGQYNYRAICWDPNNSVLSSGITPSTEFYMFLRDHNTQNGRADMMIHPEPSRARMMPLPPHAYMDLQSSGIVIGSIVIEDVASLLPHTLVVKIVRVK